MKIGVITSSAVPFERGGAERLWDGLVAHLNRETGHSCGVVSLPLRERSLPDLVRSYDAFARLDLTQFDVVVSSKYPGWMVRHPRHVVYMMHPLRGLYDTYWMMNQPPSATPRARETADLVAAIRGTVPGTDDGARRILDLAVAAVETLPPDHPDLVFPGPLARELVQWLDRDALDPAHVVRHLAISRTVATRPDYFPPGVPVGVVHTPTDVTGLQSTGYRHFFTASRLDRPKRIDLLIDAMRRVEGDVELRIAGSGPDGPRLRELAAGDPRVRFLGRVSDEDLRAEYGRALAVPFVPEDEDLGLIALEARLSAKVVVTCTDSGGCVELVEHGVDGFVVPPEPAALATVLQRLADDPATAERMGGRARVAAEAVTWHPLVEELERDPGRDARRSVVVLNTYPAFPPFHGGQVRVSRLVARLAERFDVHYLTITDGRSPTGRVAPGITQYLLPGSDEQGRLEGRLSAELAISSGDIVASLTALSLTEYVELARRLAADAAAIVVSHPYMFPIADEVAGGVPVVYDSHNAEYVLKRGMYPDTDAGRALAGAVEDVERSAFRSAELVIACSAEDLEALRALGPTLADQLVIPNGADIRRSEFVTGARRRRTGATVLRQLTASEPALWFDHLALFVGSGHQPNVDAARLVLGAAELLPGCLFVLAGGHTELLDGREAPGNVLLAGRVSTVELLTLLHGCDVALNPMLAGSGTNIKMLDYFAAGAPVVATSVGTRGLPVEDGVHLVIAAPDPAALAGSIDGVLRHPDAADTRAGAARLVAEAFDWDVLGERFADAIERVAAVSREPSPAR